MSYISFGKKISQSTHHPHLFIINYPDGGFTTIMASEETIRKRHPEGGKFHYNDEFHFHPSRARARADMPPQKIDLKKVGTFKN